MTLPAPHAIAHLIDDVKKLQEDVAAITARVLTIADIEGLEASLDALAGRVAPLEQVARIQTLEVVTALGDRVTKLEAA